MKNQTHNGDGLSSHTLLASLNARIECAESRYHEEQRQGDAVSIASTRGTFIGLRDARDIVKQHFMANAAGLAPMPGRDVENTLTNQTK